MDLREMALSLSRVDALDPPRLGLSLCSNSLTIPELWDACCPAGRSATRSPRGLDELAQRQDASTSSLISHMSTEARVPGVSAASIALNAWAPASMSSAVAKYWSTTAVPCSPS
jgi:hypothetical protein